MLVDVAWIASFSPVSTVRRMETVVLFYDHFENNEALTLMYCCLLYICIVTALSHTGMEECVTLVRTVDNSIMLTFHFYETTIEQKNCFHCMDHTTEEKRCEKVLHMILEMVGL